MRNEKVTEHEGVPGHEPVDLRAEIVELTERIQVLSLDRGIAVRRRMRAMTALHQRGASIGELADLTGMHPEDIADFVDHPAATPPG